MFSGRDLFKLILPMIIQQALTITVSTVDSMMVASAGEAAVSGVSLVGAFDALLIIAYSSLVTGGSVAVSHALGRADREFGRLCAKQLLYAATFIALLISVIVGVFREPILVGLYGGADEEVLFNANSYMRFMLISFPFLAIYLSCDAVFRVMGDTVTGLKLSLLSNILNVIGNYIFIFICGMGAAGAAAATLIARVICSVIFIIKLHNRKNAIYIEKLFRYRPDRAVIAQMLRIGVPHGIENSMFQFGRLATQVLISSMGTAAIAANSVANTLANYIYLASGAIGNAAITVVGRCIGAKEYAQARSYSLRLILVEYVCMWVVSIVLFVFGRSIIGIYNLSAEGARIAMELTIFHCIVTSLIRPPAFTLPSIFKAAGDAKYSMAVSTVSMWVIRIGFSFILAPESINIFGLTIPGMGMGIMGVWVAMAADWVLRVLLFSIRFRSGRWLEFR